MTTERWESEGQTGASSPALAAYLRKMSRVQQDEDATVALLPTLSYGFGQFSVQFAMQGPRGSYVVKSLDEFVEHLQNLDEATYGPKLSFVHRLGSFVPESRALVGFVERAVRTRRAPQDDSLGFDGLARRGGRAAGAVPAAVGRVLHLSEDETVDFLDAVGEAPFAFQCTDGSVRSRMTVHVAEGDPPALLRLVEQDGGVALMRDDALIGAFSGQRAYVLFDDVFYRCTPAFADGAEFVREVYNSEDGQLFVGADDLPTFGGAVLPRLEQVFEVQAPALLDAYRRVPCRIAFYFDRVGNTVEVLAKATYGGREIPLALAPSEVPAAVEQVREGIVVISGVADEPPESDVHPPLRDMAREQEALDLLRQYMTPSAVVPLENEDALGLLLFEGLARFQALGQVHTTAAFDRLLFSRTPRLSLGLSLAGDLIVMDVAVSDVPPEELEALLASYRRRKRFHRLCSGAFLDMSAGDVAELDRLAADLGLGPDAIAAGRVELPTYQAFYLDNELGSAYREDGFKRFVDRYRQLYRRAVGKRATGSDAGASESGDGRTGEGDAFDALLPDGLVRTLRPYQRAGAQWIDLLWECNLGGILADEMGLGKTVQAIAALMAHDAREAQAADGEDRSVRGEGNVDADDETEVTADSHPLPHLIVCPAAVVYNWAEEWARFVPGTKVAVVAGSADERAVARHGGARVLITSYDLLRRDAAAWEALPLDCVVLDEAHAIKNHATRTARAVKRLRSRHRLALTGTPMENRLSELWSIMDFLMPGLLGPYQRFRERFEAAIIGGDEETARRLRLLTAPFILRRTKAQVAPELPDKTRIVVPVALEGEQRRLYDAVEQSLRERLAAQMRLSRSREARCLTGKQREARAPRVQVLAELSQLRRIALDPALVFENYEGGSAKMEVLLDVVARGAAEGRKMLVYSQFTSFLDRVAERLRALEVPFYLLTGSTPKKERQRLTHAFNGDDTPVFLISLKAGGTGLNLTGATMVVHTDPWWNEAASRQAADRAHRIGQSRAVDVYELVAEGTIEERMRALAAMKAELAALVVGEEAEGGLEAAQTLTSEELYELLGG